MRPGSSTEPGRMPKSIVVRFGCGSERGLDAHPVFARRADEAAGRLADDVDLVGQVRPVELDLDVVDVDIDVRREQPACRQLIALGIIGDVGELRPDIGVADARGDRGGTGIELVGSADVPGPLGREQVRTRLGVDKVRRVVFTGRRRAWALTRRALAQICRPTISGKAAGVDQRGVRVQARVDIGEASIEYEATVVNLDLAFDALYRGLADVEYGVEPGAAVNRVKLEVVVIVIERTDLGL